jgi:hypothetical protein
MGKSRSCAIPCEKMRKQRKKLYYSAGLISIILLPIFCLIYLNNINAFKKFGSIDISLPDKEFRKDNVNLKRYLNSKKYFIINLTGDNKTDELKLKNANILIKKIILSKDSIQGVKFNFGKKSEYWTFIKILDILVINNAQLYDLQDNELWFTNPPKLKNGIKKSSETEKNINSKTNYVNCGTQYVNLKSQEVNEIENIGINEFIKNYYLSIIAYLLMIYFTFKRYKQKME